MRWNGRQTDVSGTRLAAAFCSASGVCEEVSLSTLLLEFCSFFAVSHRWANADGDWK